MAPTAPTLSRFVIPLSRGADHGCLEALLKKPFHNDRPTLKLLAGRENPVPDRPPAGVRAARYHYRFSTPSVPRQSGAWWVRARLGEMVRPVRRAVT